WVAERLSRILQVNTFISTKGLRKLRLCIRRIGFIGSIKPMSSHSRYPESRHRLQYLCLPCQTSVIQFKQVSRLRPDSAKFLSAHMVAGPRASRRVGFT